MIDSYDLFGGIILHLLSSLQSAFEINVMLMQGASRLSYVLGQDGLKDRSVVAIIVHWVGILLDVGQDGCLVEGRPKHIE